MIALHIFVVLACLAASVSGADLPIPAAMFPLNAQFGTEDISKNQLPPGKQSGITLDVGPDGKQGGSYYFSGTSGSYIEFPQNSKLDTKYSITLLAMIFPESKNGPIFDYKSSGHWRVHLWVHTWQLFWRVADRSSFVMSAAVQHPLNMSEWSYVGATYDYSTGLIKVWINGHNVGELNVTSMEIATESAVRIGAKEWDDYAPRYFKGRVACLQVYDKALTQNQIAAVKTRCSKIEPHSICYDHETVITDPTRNAMFVTKDSPATDFGSVGDLRPRWYRFTGLPGTQLPTSCVPEGRCGTQASGWLNGSYPSLESGITRAKVCFNWAGNCCLYNMTVYLRRCNGFYLFKFEPLNFVISTKARYCVEGRKDTSSASITAYHANIGTGLVDHVIYSESLVPSVTWCTGYCTLHSQCRSLNYNLLTSTCELSNSTRDAKPADPRLGFQYYEATEYEVYYLP